MSISIITENINNKYHLPCIICLEDIKTFDRGVNQQFLTSIGFLCNCNKSYHFKCINNWIFKNITKPTCPTCRKTINIPTYYYRLYIPSNIINFPTSRYNIPISQYNHNSLHNNINSPIINNHHNNHINHHNNHINHHNNHINHHNNHINIHNNNNINNRQQIYSRRPSILSNICNDLLDTLCNKKIFITLIIICLLLIIIVVLFVHFSK
jgi:hypothetical protein